MSGCGIYIEGKLTACKLNSRMVLVKTEGKCITKYRLVLFQMKQQLTMEIKFSQNTVCNHIKKTVNTGGSDVPVTSRTTLA